MLVDHCFRFLHASVPGALWVGRVAFPCFVLGVALQVAPQDLRRVGRRIALAGVLLWPLFVFVTREPAQCVLCTLGVGLVLAEALHGSWSVRSVLVCLLCCVAACVCEYGLPGVCAVAGFSLLLRGRADRLALACAMVAVALLLLVRVGSAPAAAGWCVAISLLFAPIAVRRFRGVFMRLYVSQWVALAVPGIAAAAGSPFPPLTWQDWAGGLFLLTCVFYTLLHVFWSLVPRVLRHARRKLVKASRPVEVKNGSTPNA